MWNLIFLCLARLAIGQSITSAVNISTTSTSSLSTITAAANTSQICCSIFVDFVALNVWYNSSLEYTKETVITKFAQYNNTVVPSTTVTIANNVTNSYSYGTRVDVEGYQYSFSNIPNIIGSDAGWYDGTAVDSSTIWQDNYTSIASPTPFAIVSTAFFIAGYSSGTECLATYSRSASTQTVTAWSSTALPSTFTISPGDTITESGTTYYVSGTTYTQTAESGGGMYTIGSDDLPIEFGGGDLDSEYATVIALDPPWYWIPGLEFTGNWSNGGTEREFYPPPDLISFLDSQPSVKSKFPFLTQCGVGGGMGAPTVHIPVAELTIERATTIPVGGNFGGGGGGGGNTGVGGAGGGMTTTAGYPPPTSHPAQPHTTTQAIGPPTTTAQPNTGSTLPMGSDSIHPASPPAGQPPSSASPQAEPQSKAGSGSGGNADPGQPQSKGSGSASNSGSGSNDDSGSGSNGNPGSGSGSDGGASQAAGAGPQGSQGPTEASGPAVGSNAVSAINSGSGASGNSNNDGGSQAGGGAGAHIASALRSPEGGSSNTAGGNSAVNPGIGNNGDSGNDEGSEYSVPGQGNPGQASAATTAPVIIGDTSANPVAPGAYALPGGHTISAGGAPVVVAGKTYSLGPSGAVAVNGQIVSSIAPYQPGSGHVSFGNAIATPLGSNAVLIGGQTLSVGGAPVVASGTTYSLGPSGAVVVNGQTVSKLPAYSNPTPIAIGDAVATPIGSNAYAIGSQTLRAGDEPITVSGTTYSLSPSGAVIINGHTVSSLPPGSEYDYPISGSLTALTLGTAVYAATPTVGSGLVIDGQTLLPGHAITVTQDGHVETISVPSNGLENGGYVGVVNGVTQSLAPGQTLLTEPNGVVLTLSPTGVGEFVVGGSKTLVPGDEAIVTNGVTISEAPDGDVIEASGGVTSTIGSAQGGGGGVGYYVHSGIGGASTSTPAAFLGEGTRLGGGLGVRLASVGAVIFGVGVLAL